jgi:hypothetical protein
MPELSHAMHKALQGCIVPHPLFFQLTPPSSFATVFGLCPQLDASCIHVAPAWAAAPASPHPALPPHHASVPHLTCRAAAAAACARAPRRRPSFLSAGRSVSNPGFLCALSGHPSTLSCPIALPRPLHASATTNPRLPELRHACLGSGFALLATRTATVSPREPRTPGAAYCRVGRPVPCKGPYLHSSAAGTAGSLPADATRCNAWLMALPPPQHSAFQVLF